MAFAKKKETSFQILPIEDGVVKVHLLGTTALYMNRMSKKAREQLLLPPRTSNRAARETVQKHDPPAEFNEALYRCRDEKAPTLTHVPAGALKGALTQTALRTPGATKTEIGCLVKVLDPTVYLYGRPFLKMDIVRQGGINKTPDVRTRAYFPEWCCEFEIWYVKGFIRESDIANLVSRAGLINGIGDGRTEKGKFDYGSWELVTADDPRYLEIKKHQGRKVQIDAMDHPVAADEDTQELLLWYHDEIRRREVEPKTIKKSKTIKDAVIADQEVQKVRASKGNGRRKARD